MSHVIGTLSVSGGRRTPLLLERENLEPRSLYKQNFLFLNLLLFKLKL